jgi:hypothetical protein
MKDAASKHKQHPLATLVKDIEWDVRTVGSEDPPDTLYAAHVEGGGALTVLDRMTGYSSGLRDIESGWNDGAGGFWLASGNQDIRDEPELSINGAIEWVKAHANTVKGPADKSEEAAADTTSAAPQQDDAAAVALAASAGAPQAEQAAGTAPQPDAVPQADSPSSDSSSSDSSSSDSSSSSSSD